MKIDFDFTNPIDGSHANTPEEHQSHLDQMKVIIINLGKSYISGLKAAGKTQIEIAEIMEVMSVEVQEKTL